MGIKDKADFDRVITFRPSEKLSEWLSEASEKARQSGVKFNLSELIKSRLELSVDLLPNVIVAYDGYDFTEGISMMLKDSMAVLLNIRKKVLSSAPLTQNEWYFLFYQLHRAYASSRKAIYLSDLLISVIDAFELMFNAAIGSKCKLSKSDYYFAGNFAHYEQQPIKRNNSHAETKERILITKKRILKQGLLCADAAEFYSRGLEVLLLKTRMAPALLDELLGLHKYTLLMLATKEVSLRAGNLPIIAEAELLPKNFFKKLESTKCSVSVSTFDGKYVADLSIFQEQFEVKVQLNFPELEDVAKTIISKQNTDPLVITHWSFAPEKFELEFKGRANISVSPEMLKELSELFVQYFTDPEIKQIRMMAGQAYGLI